LDGLRETIFGLTQLALLQVNLPDTLMSRSGIRFPSQYIPKLRQGSIEHTLLEHHLTELQANTVSRWIGSQGLGVVTTGHGIVAALRLNVSCTLLFLWSKLRSRSLSTVHRRLLIFLALHHFFVLSHIEGRSCSLFGRRASS